MNVKAVNLKNQLGPTLNGEKAVELNVGATEEKTKKFLLPSLIFGSQVFYPFLIAEFNKKMKNLE